MGVCINYTLAQQTDRVKDTLDNAQALAERYKSLSAQIGRSVEIRRISDTSLLIDIEGCETLAFEFESMPAEPQRGEDGYKRTWDPFEDYRQLHTTGDHYERWPNQVLLWAKGFCKTQYAPSLTAHRMVAELVRAVAGRCKIASVYDEGDYYHTGKIEDADNAIKSNQAVIDALGLQLSGLGYDIA